MERFYTKKALLNLFIFFSFLLGSCNTVYKNTFTKNEERLQTTNKRYFHELVIPKPELHKTFDGVILGFEKIRNKRISNRNRSKQELLQAYNLDVKSAYLNAGKQRLARRSARLVSHKKSMVLTHLVRKNGSGQLIDFNLYDNNPQEWVNYNLYQQTKIQLDSLALRLDRQIKNGKYTHLLMMSTGWNNTQIHSMERYNQWMDSLAGSARVEGTIFNPLYIGITWPSFWKVGNKQLPLDFFNVSKAADRLGIEQINYLLWKSIVPLADKYNLPIIMIGHSLGARILTRAAYSGILFKEKVDTKNKIDLMIGLQAAYRYDRHIGKANKNDGGLYSINEPFKKMVATTSKQDEALSKVFWSLYMGNSKTMDALKKNDSANIALNSIDSLGYSLPDTLPSKITIYDASALISYHSDVGNPLLAVFMWRMIKQFAVRRK